MHNVADIDLVVLLQGGLSGSNCIDSSALYHATHFAELIII